MILTISTTHQPATDLGFLLHKNPENIHTKELSFGTGVVFYPEATVEKCTAALMVDIDPIKLVRVTRAETQYVNDRPYVVSSYLSSALSTMFGTALGGRSKLRQELANQPIPLEIRLPVVFIREGLEFLQSIFLPLGYELQASRLALDAVHPEWGDSHYYDITLRGNLTVKDALSHIYVLIPVLDDEKHYYLNTDETDKLLRRSTAWLTSHPAKEQIVRRYMMRKAQLTRQTLALLAESTSVDESEIEKAVPEEALEQKGSLHKVRLDTVIAELIATGAKSVLDLGCGEGRLLQLLLKKRQFTKIIGMDVAHSALDRAERRLKLDEMASHSRERISLIQGALTYRDARLEGFDAAALVEVIEHLDEERLRAFEQSVFKFARPRVVIVTTPNSEYNVLFETLVPGTMRHKDHRFEWTRSQFSNWAQNIATTFGYEVVLKPVGPEDVTHGAPSQMAVFKR